MQPDYILFPIDGNYRYGYTVTQSIKRDRAIFGKIKYDQLRVCGAGQHCFVVTDGTYAIKVGHISDYQAEKLDTAAKYGFSPPLYYYKRNKKLSRKFINALQRLTLSKYGDTVSLEEYIFNGCADIAILGLAQPFADHKLYTRGEDIGGGLFTLLSELANACESVCNVQWSDWHEFNIGMYNSGLVILDF